jgi:hypothetical protein
VTKKTRLGAALVVATLAGLLAAGLGAGHRVESTSADLTALPAAPSPALRIGRPSALTSGRYLSRWTVLRSPAVARTAPSARSAVVAQLPAHAPEGTPNLLPVLRASSRERGALWVEVRLPVLPAGTLGWVRRDALGPYQLVDTHLVVDRAELRATLYRNGKVIFSAPVGIGTQAAPTPGGEYTVRSKLTRYASPFYGPVAFGTTARSAVLTDWPDGGFVGIHGTSDPEAIPGRVSHGCIRLRNSDIIRLAQLMPIGTPVSIQ